MIYMSQSTDFVLRLILQDTDAYCNSVHIFIEAPNAGASVYIGHISACFFSSPV